MTVTPQVQLRSRKSSLPQTFAVLTCGSGDFVGAAALGAQMAGIKCLSVLPSNIDKTTIQVGMTLRVIAVERPLSEKGSLMF